MKFKGRVALFLSLALAMTTPLSGAFAADAYASEPGSASALGTELSEPSAAPGPDEEVLPASEITVPDGAKGVFVLDTYTGEVLGAKNANKSLHAASTSKLMTAYLVHDKIASGNGKWNDKIKITDKKIEKMSSTSPFGGSVKLKKGRVFTVRQLYYLTLVESNNAASVQLGRWVAGSDKKFAKMMSEKAASLGMTKSKFVNACGLPNSDYKRYLKMPYVGKSTDANKMSPRDAATLANALIAEYPEVLKTTKSSNVTVKGKTIRTTNKLLKDKNLKKQVKKLNVDGLKTGTTEKAGSCLISTCKPNGRSRIIVVIMNDNYVSRDTAAVMTEAYL